MDAVPVIKMLCPLGILVIAISQGGARETVVPHYVCDHGQNTIMKEGNQGPVENFPWLGVIRVTLSEGSKQRIAVTGAVLVRITFAIANAEDMAKIPKKIIRDHSKAMFMSSDNSPWLYALKGFITHPEYRHKTMSSIALVELQLKDDPTPLVPVCWPEHVYDISYKHYALGYTDENYLLEKEAYEMHYVNKSYCENYYEGLDMHDGKYVPVSYQCWAAMSNTRDCVWENGMMLVSNFSGTWVLIGIGIRGPGCALPVRFIAVYPYLGWIETVVDEAALRMNSEKLKPKVKERPAHSFYKNDHEDLESNGPEFRRAYDNRRTPPASWPPLREYDGAGEYDRIASDYARGAQGSGREGPNYRIQDPNYRGSRRKVDKPEEVDPRNYKDEHWKRDDIRHMDPNVINIVKFGNMYERAKGDCSKTKHLSYKEATVVTAMPHIIGFASYKLSLVDLEKYQYTCIVIRVKSRNRTDCHLWYSIAQAVDEPLAMLDDTPEELLKHYIPVGDRSTTGPFETNAIYWEPHQNIEPYHLKDEDAWTPRWWTNLPMLNLFIKFDFIEKAELILEVWSPYSNIVSQLLTTTDRKMALNHTRTRKPGHNVTRSRKPKTPKKREINRKYATKKATVIETDKRHNIKDSNGSSYVGVSSLCGIVVLFISAFLT